MPTWRERPLRVKRKRTKKRKNEKTKREEIKIDLQGIQAQLAEVRDLLRDMKTQKENKTSKN